MKILAMLFAIAAIAGAVLLAIPGKFATGLLTLMLSLIAFGLCRLIAWVLKP